MKDITIALLSCCYSSAQELNSKMQNIQQQVDSPGKTAEELQKLLAQAQQYTEEMRVLRIIVHTCVRKS